MTKEQVVLSDSELAPESGSQVAQGSRAKEKCLTTLKQLLRSTSRDSDRRLRALLRSQIQMAHECRTILHMDEPSSELGGLMFQANVRSRARGWL